jgi:hypothetical protein
MKTQVTLNTFQGVLARDRLKKTSTQRFTVLYDLLLYLVVPVAFELSYIKVLQRSLHAYQTNDAMAMSRLIIYLLIQSFLGLLVHKKYVKEGLKKITLALLILLQLKEAFFEEVLVDMVISMVLESGWALLAFVKLSYLLVYLKIGSFIWLLNALFLMGICVIVGVLKGHQPIPAFYAFRVFIFNPMVGFCSCYGKYNWRC